MYSTQRHGRGRAAERGAALRDALHMLWTLDDAGERVLRATRPRARSRVLEEPPLRTTASVTPIAIATRRDAGTDQDAG